MKKTFFLFCLFLAYQINYAQDTPTTVKGVVINAANDVPLESVNIINITQVLGTTTNVKGEFEVNAKPNDTLHFSYLGFKSIKVKVTNDWLKYGSSNIALTELAFALEEVVVNQLNLTGYLEVDIKNVTQNKNYRYAISGLPSTGYEAGNRSTNTVTKVLGAIFNPADFLYRMFGKQPNEMRKLRKMKKDDEIRNLLANRFDREMLMVLLKVNRVDLDEIISQCNYSKDFINSANDLQVLDAISECYEEYKILEKSKSGKF